MATSAKIPVNLSAREAQAVEKLLSRLRTSYGSQIRQVFLFGSKARGDSNGDSDIDVLLLVEKESWTLKDEICGLAAEINLESDLQLDTRVIGVERWRHLAEIQAGLYRTITQDAIPLAG